MKKQDKPSKRPINDNGIIVNRKREEKLRKQQRSGKNPGRLTSRDINMAFKDWRDM